MEIDSAAISWNKALLDNAAVPGGVFKIPVAHMATNQRSELKAAIAEEYTGENRFQAMILWGGVEWTQMGLGPADMQYLNQREVNKYEICGILGVPPMVVGATQDPTYANYEVGRLAWWEDGIIPLLEWIRNKVNAQIAPSFGPNIRIHYDLSRTPAMRKALSEAVASGYKMWQMGWPINAINKRFGLGMDDVPWGDKAYLQINMAPIDELQGPGNPDLDTTPKPPKPNDPAGTDEEDNTDDNEDVTA
jgi:HK97 family phage portal protein